MSSGTHVSRPVARKTEPSDALWGSRLAVARPPRRHPGLLRVHDVGRRAQRQGCSQSRRRQCFRQQWNGRHARHGYRHRRSRATAGLQSYAGAAPANADALAAAHKPFPAALPAAPAGPIANVNLVLTDITVQIAPGVKYSAWAWAGGAPGPVIHVRQGQLVKITLTNNGAIPHSVDFHAARVAPDKAFGDVMPGKSVSYTFRANDAGVFMYHCGTKPVLMHIANGMYGAIVVEPRPGVLPKADKQLRSGRQRVVPRLRRPRVRPRSSTWRRPTRASPTG